MTWELMCAFLGFMLIATVIGVCVTEDTNSEPSAWVFGVVYILGALAFTLFWVYNL